MLDFILKGSAYDVLTTVKVGGRLENKCARIILYSVSLLLCGRRKTGRVLINLRKNSIAKFSEDVPVRIHEWSPFVNAKEIKY